MMFLWLTIISALTYLVLSATIPKLLKADESILIPAIPNFRSSHEVVKYSSAGILFVPFLLMALIPYYNFSLFLFSVSLITLNLTGYIDDKKNISAKARLLIELFCAVLIWYGEVRVTSLFGLFGIFDISEFFSLLITVFLFIAIVNAFNLIDGVDGLAGGLTLLSGLAFSIFFLVIGNYALMTFSFALVTCMIAFLKFNFYPSKVFMGDSGSLIVGASFAYLFLKSISVEDGNYIGFSWSLVLLPILDMTRIFLHRIMHKSSPFKADKNHYHHLLLKNRLNHRNVAVTCWFQSISFLLFWSLFLSASSPVKQVVTISLFALSIYIYVRLISVINISRKLRKVRRQKENILIQNNLHQIIYNRYEKNTRY